MSIQMGRGRELAGRALAAGTWLVVAVVILQVLLAGIGVFAFPSVFFWHATVNAAVVFFLPLVLLALGWWGRAPGRLLWWIAALPALVIVQSLLLVPYHLGLAGPFRAVAGLHAANALLIFWVSLQLLARTRDWSSRSPVG